MRSKTLKMKMKTVETTLMRKKTPMMRSTQQMMMLIPMGATAPFWTTWKVLARRCGKRMMRRETIAMRT